MSRLLRTVAAAPLALALGAIPLQAALAQQSMTPKAGVPAPVPVAAPSLADTADSGTMKRADADMALVLKKLMALGVKPIASRSVEEARSQPTPADAVKAVMKDMGKDPMAVMAAMKVSKKDMTYPTGGGTQPVRIYTPEGEGSSALPVVVYYHGGGWVIADIDAYEASAMALAKQAKAIVVSVEYRRAPEHKFPAAFEDAFAAYKWVVQNAGQFNGDPQRLALAGESAGGNMAVNVAIMARDQHLQPPVQVVSIYPVAGTDMHTPSYIKNQNAVPLSAIDLMWFFNKTLAKPADIESPMLNLTTKADLKGLPPTTVITDSIDPLMSDGEMLANKLQQAGVQTTYANYTGVTHEFFGMAPVVAKATQAQALVASQLTKSFAAARRHADADDQKMSPSGTSDQTGGSGERGASPKVGTSPPDQSGDAGVKGKSDAGSGTTHPGDK